MEGHLLVALQHVSISTLLTRLCTEQISA